MSLPRGKSGKVFWGMMILLSLITGFVLEWLDLFWNLWAQLVASVLVLAGSIVFTVLIMRWTNDR